VEHGHNDFYRWPIFFFVPVYRNSTTVITNGDTIVHVDDDVDLLAEACQGFVNAIVDDLMDEVM
jgi:hypothetical protein